MIAVWKHELKNYFHSLTAYIFGAFLLAFIGLGALRYNIQAAVSNFEFVLSYGCLIFVVIVPILTMRVIAEEKKVLVAQMDNDPKMATKPQQVKEKIAAGKLNKFYEENCLLQQAFVKDGSMSVEQYMDSAAKALGGKVTFVDAVRFEKGEGIEKKQENFAAEIASMVNGNK